MKDSIWRLNSLSCGNCSSYKYWQGSRSACCAALASSSLPAFALIAAMLLMMLAAYRAPLAALHLELLGNGTELNLLYIMLPGEPSRCVNGFVGALCGDILAHTGICWVDLWVNVSNCALHIGQRDGCVQASSALVINVPEEHP